MKICIIGSNGFFGRNLTYHCTKHGFEIQLISSNAPNGIDSETGLFRQDFSINKPTDIVIYLSQSPYYRDTPNKAEHLVSVNCIAAIQAAKAAIQADVKKFFYASTGNVYAPSLQSLKETDAVNRTNWYSLSKLMGEDALQLFKNSLQITILRIFGLYGPKQKDKLIPILLNNIISGKTITLDENPQGQSGTRGLRINPLFIDDASEILINLFKKEKLPNIINIAGNEILSIEDISNIISLKINSTTKFQSSEKIKPTDLIADTQLLTQQHSVQLTPFSVGLDYLLSELPN